jgi:hypothetical protein
VIERAEKTNGVVSSFEPIAQVNRNVTSYVDDTTEADVTYEYRVEAFNVAATNSVRRAVKVTTP